MESIALPLPPTIRSKLLSAGFRTLVDFQGVGPVELAREASLTYDEALNVLGLVPGADALWDTSFAAAGAKSAWELLHQEKMRRRISTLCPEFDHIVAGGIVSKEVTEICGVPGVGKTQMGMQLAINVQIPEELGGLGGQAVYVDTEGSFSVERALEMAHGMLTDVQDSLSQESDPNRTDLIARITPDDILSNIFYFRIFEYSEQIAFVNVLEEFLEQHPQVRLLVMDSVTFHFRQDFPDLVYRTKLLNGMAQKLMAISDKHDIAVVLVNQVTTKTVGEVSKLVPAMGDSWSHTCTNRIILHWREGIRTAHLYKSPSLKSQSAFYYITSSGIRGPPDTNKRQKTEDYSDQVQ